MSGAQDLARALTGITARLDKIDQGLKDNATKQDMTKVQDTLTNITNQMNNNTSNIEWLMERRKEDYINTDSQIKEAVGDCVRKQIEKIGLSASLAWRKLRSLNTLPTMNREGQCGCGLSLTVMRLQKKWQGISMQHP